MYYISGMSKRKTTEEFINEARLKHGDKYDYSLVDYVNNKKNVKILCLKHSVFEQSPSNHIHNYRPQGCPHCVGRNKTTSSVINEFKEKHGSLYDYSLVRYVNNSSKVKIICKTHGVFEQTPSGHLSGSGCNSCAGNVKKTTEEFIHESKKLHGDKYDYRLVFYKSNNEKIKIICKEHGIFNQTPSSHLNGNGCLDCSLNISRNNPTGWTVTQWEKLAKESKYFDSFKVYIIRCWDENEEFYKIGRTYNTVKNRFRSKIKMPYNYEILQEIVFDNARDCFNKEAELKRLYKDFKYSPTKVFGGVYECFYKIDIRD
jgi:hypothetical protein